MRSLWRTPSGRATREEILFLASDQGMVHGKSVALGLAVEAIHAEEQTPRFSRVFDRWPVLVGRDDEIATCVLDDGRVSRLHASFDIRDGAICVRDSGSTNGTFVEGERIPFDRWVPACPVNRTCEIRIAEWRLKVSTSELEASAPSADGDFLTALPPEPAPQAQQASPTGVAPADFDPLNERRHTLQLAGPGTYRVLRAWGMLVSARSELVKTVAEVLQATPPPQRPQVVRDILQACESIEREPAVRAILEHHGGAPLPHTLESGAVLALQELARWYVNDQPPLRSAAEVFSFARKLKAGIDELLLGLVPMFAALDRFEQQLALRPADGGPDGDFQRSSRLPRVPRDAARLLFNWRDLSDNAVRAVRTDLVDLTMHQVAVLNGVMRGVTQLLAELAPGTIEVALGRRLQKRSFFGRVFSSLRATKERWELYRERHADLADEENERFRVIFGPEFVAEYKQSGEAAVAHGGSNAANQRPLPPQNRN